MQTILGAGGAVGKALAKVLPEYTTGIKLVSRVPKKINPDDVTVSTNLIDEEAVSAVVKGSEVTYLTVGLPYDSKLWAEEWPKVMKNVISACLEHQSKLVFFDNLYLYEGLNMNPITEESTVNPQTKKGIIRARLVEMLQRAIKEDGLQALIARSADFYGPGVKTNGILREMVIKPLSKGSTAYIFASDKYQHSYTYVPDAARAMAMLGNDEKAYGETWHLPTAENPPNGKEWVEMVAKEFGVKPKYRVISKFAARLFGMFVPVVKESIEMLYQYNRDYVFDSSKFNQQYSFTPTPYSEGLKETLKQDFPKKKE